jgi:two-component sensor histidine kinase
MNSHLQQYPGLAEHDRALLQQIERGAPITADLCRADLLICAQSEPEQGLIVYHAAPHSIPSLYRQPVSGQTFRPQEQPLTFQALTSGSGGRRQREVLRNGAPVLQDVFPIHNRDGNVIAAMVIETSMIAYERQKRRNRHFRQVIVWLQEMLIRGELIDAETLSHFGQYDGVYLVNRNRTITYMSGTSSNLFRTIGIVVDVVGEQLTLLEELDQALVEQVFAEQRCLEVRHESADGRVWLRKGVPVRAPAAGWLDRWLAQPWYGAPRSGKSKAIDAVLVLVHNATEAVQKQRELNVKAAVIQEVHHRVKNNLQNIAAILRMQARRSKSEEARQYLNDAVNRVLSMSVIHEFLSQDEHRPINLRDICQRIGAQVVQVASTAEKELRLQVQGPNIWLPASQATPAALILNELLLNAVEHGLAERIHGTIDVRLDDLGDAVALAVVDNGNGLPPDFQLDQHTSLGLQIVRTLVTDDLKGHFRLEPKLAESVPAGDASAEPVGPVPMTGVVGTQALITFPKRSLGVD